MTKSHFNTCKINCSGGCLDCAPDDHIGELVMHRQTRYIGRIEAVRGLEFKDQVKVKWNLGFSDWYPTDWLERIDG